MVTNGEGVRINRYIADSGACSRREADRLIEAARVTIGGRPATLGDKVFPGMRVLIDDRPVGSGAEKVYIALHKPVGIVSTADPREPMNIVEYLGFPERIYPVGRLDKNSSGLILLTNDGAIVNKLLRAAGGHEKEYAVKVDRPYTQSFVRKMETGVEILGVKTRECRLIRVDDTRFRLILTQGLNRQIRRMCESLGYRVVSLMRDRVMNIRLGNLKPGEWRFLTERERSELLSALDETKEGNFHEPDRSDEEA